MRKIFTVILTTLCLSAAFSQPVLARDNHHNNNRNNGWHDNGNHNGWRNNHRPNWNRVVYRPAPVVRYYAPLPHYYDPYYQPYPYGSTSLSFFFR